MPDTGINPLIQEYIVDFSSNNNFFFVNGIQGDGFGVRYARISLSNNGQPYILNENDVRAVIMGTKPDTNEICNECEIIDNSTIEFEITQQMLAVKGKGTYSISIMSKTENRMLTSFPFFIISHKSSFDAGHITSSNEFLLLISKINQVDKVTGDANVAIADARAVIKDCTEKTKACVEATNNANTATSDLRELETSVRSEESKRVQAEVKRQTNTTEAIKNANTATSNANNATSDLRDLENTVKTEEAKRVQAEKLRQSNTATAIKNAEKAALDANNAKAGAITATTEVQKRIDQYDSLNVPTVVQNAITATNNAKTATSNANNATTSANNAAKSANDAAADARKAIAEIQESIGIDDTKESLNTVWSSTKTHQVITQDIATAMGKITEIPNSKIDELFANL